MSGTRQQNPLEFWKAQNGVRHITPGGMSNPEGDWFAGEVADIARAFRDVVDYGCGPGRLSGLFDPDGYLGLDVNANALDEARKRNPQYSYRLIDDGPMPVADCYFCHTVLLHVPDTDLSNTIRRFNTDCVIVSEILGRMWRRRGEPPVFNREFYEYAQAFGSLGFNNIDFKKEIYEHYPNTMLTIMRFERGPDAEHRSRKLS